MSSHKRKMVMKRLVFGVVATIAIAFPAASVSATDIPVTASQAKATLWNQTVSGSADTVVSETILRTRSSTNTNYKSWIQFDLTSTYAANPGLKGNVASATLTLAASGTLSNKTYIVNGLNNSAGLEGWSSSTITWNGAPGNSTSSTTALNSSLTTGSLGTGTIDGADATLTTVSGTSLTSFVNTDTDGLITFILTPGGTTSFYGAGSTYPPTLTLTTTATASTLAFPGAEGWGAYSVGGRGGDVYHVTNLNDTGTGSLRYGITSAGGTSTTPRTIVFDVSGTIVLTSSLSVNKSYITIAGQTAPGDGICLRDHSMTVSGSNVIIRYLRVRLGDESLTEDDGIWISGGHDIIMDHISSGWSVDEAFSCSTDTAGLTNITVQWSMITEALNNSVHAKGAHGYGALIRGCYDGHYSYHHNLWVHNASRNPRPGNYDTNTAAKDPCGLLFDFRNNVIYNWNGSNPGYDADTLSICRYNYVGNWAKPGVNSSAGYLYSAGCKLFTAYYSGNYFNGTYASDEWAWVNFSGWTTAQKTAYKMSVPFATGPIATDTALVAYQRVLNHGGASLPKRDSVDTRVVGHVVNNAGKIIDTQNQVGGWPTLNSTTPPTDTDQDGMPDAWETANGLDPANAADRNNYTLNADYTNLEVYLNSLVPNGTYDTDTTPPTPSQLTWLSVPTATSSTQITMSVSPATDPSGVEYYFTCTAGGGHNSGWQASNTYTDTSLAAGTTYTYAAVARDKSTAANVQTTSSTAQSATTKPYACTASISGDINGDCQVNMTDLAVLANTWPTPTLAANLVTNGTFATDISGWQSTTLTGSSGTVTPSWSSTEGNPAGSAYLQNPGSTSNTIKNRFYQVLPVVKGHSYKFSGDWKGSLLGSIVVDPCSTVTKQNAAEVRIGWSDTATPDWGPVSVIYRKSMTPKSTYWQNITSTGTWAWESISSSAAWSMAPTNDIYVATGNYMVIAFDLEAVSNSGATWIAVDNVKVQEVAPCPTGDANGDCILDMRDVAVLANNWLLCNRSPSAQCWQ